MFFNHAHLQKGRSLSIFLAQILCTIPPCLSLYTLVANEFSNADLVYADFSHTKKKIVSQGVGVHENLLLFA